MDMSQVQATLPSNWGRWGDDDEKGALNLIDDAARARGAAEARTGRSVSIARSTAVSSLIAAPGMFPPKTSTAVQTSMMFTGANPAGLAELMIVTNHHPLMTHIDAVAHIVTDGSVYPGKPLAEAVTPWGMRHGSTESYGPGIVTRGVLLDLAPDGARLPVSYGIGREDLEAAAARENVTVQPGDALVVRAGWDYAADVDKGLPGMRLSAVEWMHDNGISLYAGDIGDAHPPIPGDFPGALHRVALGRLGIPLVDVAAPDELAAVCREENRWTFLLVVAPPRIEALTGVPVNPIAVF